MTTESTSRPVIFLAFANDRDETVGYLRNLPEEARILREVLESAETAGLCEVLVRTNCTASDIFKVFQDPRYRNRIAVFHYGGHANGYQLLLESASGGSVQADAAGLAEFLSQQQGLQLVFLNGCSTQEQAEGLLEAGISAVIATSRAIDDQVATRFSEQFYRSMAGGTAVRTAWNEAVAAVKTETSGQQRGAWFGKADGTDSREQTDRWPWDLYLRDGSEIVENWNLPSAANDPLFGLPPLPEQDLPESPFRHLNWFTRKDAEVFFGRGHQIRELYDRLTAARSAPIILFYGQSGVGKSSILDAGLVPRLEQDYQVRYLRRDHRQGLAETLHLAFLPESAGIPLSEAWCHKEQETGQPLIVVLDQVEELFTRTCEVATPTEELAEFLKLLQAIFVKSDQRPRGKLVLGFRKEWLAEIEGALIEHELPRSRVFLEPLDRRGVIEAIRGPASTPRLQQQYGLTIEDGLPELIADDLLADQDSAIAPTLQILLTKMWNRARSENYEHPQFTQSLHQKLKRDGILMRDFLNQQIESFHERYPDDVDSGLLLDLVSLHTTPLGTADQRDVPELQQLYAHQRERIPDLLQQCQDLHLLTIVAGPGEGVEKSTRLAHDTLAPLVRERFEESDKPGQRARRILDSRSVDWTDEQEGTPLDSADLQVVEQGIRGTRQLNPTEQRLLEASRLLQSRLQRNRKILKLVGLVAVVLISVSAVVAFWQWSAAEKSRDDAVAAKTDAESARDSAELAKDDAYRAKQATDVALELTQRETYNQQLLRVRELWAQDPEGAIDLLLDEQVCRPNLRDFTWHHYYGLSNRQRLVISDPDTQFQSVAFSPDGKTLASGNVDGLVQLWDAETGQLQRTLTGHQQWIGNVVFHPGRNDMVVSGSADGTVRIWDINKDEEPTILGQAGLYNGYLAISGNGNLLALARQDNQVDVVRLRTGKVRDTLESDHEITCLAFFQGDENEICGGANGGHLMIWNTRSGQREDIPPASPATIRSVAFAQVPDRNNRVAFASVGDDGSCQIFGQERDVIRVGATSLCAIDWSPDGHRVAVAGDNQLISILGDLDASETVLAGHESSVTALTYSPDGDRIASASRDGTIRVWDSSGIRSMIWQNQIKLAAAFSPDNQIVATANGTGQIILSDRQTGGLRKVLSGHDGPIFSIDFGPDGRLVSAGSDSTVRIWTPSNSSRPVELNDHQGEVFEARWTADGRHIISAGRNGDIRVWEVESGECQRIWQTRTANAETRALAISADDTVAIGSGAEIELWNWRSGEFLGSRSGHRQTVMDLAWSIDGILASASADKTMRLWNENTRLCKEVELTGIVSSIAFSHNGRSLVSVCWDGTVQLWDPLTGHQRTILDRAAGAIYSVAFSPNDQFLITGENGKFRIWEGPPVRQPTVVPTARPASTFLTAAEASSRVTLIADDQWQALAGYTGEPLSTGDEFQGSGDIPMIWLPPGEFMMGSKQTPEELGLAYKERPEIFLDEQPCHRVQLTRPFLIGKHEITNAQFQQFVDATGYRTDAERDRKWHGDLDPNSGFEQQYRPGGTWLDPGLETRLDDDPVVLVSWNDADAYCRWLSQTSGMRYRLPTEAEWEYACRAGTETRYSSGDEVVSLKRVANVSDKLHAEYDRQRVGRDLWYGVRWDDGFATLSPVGSFQANPWGLLDMHGNVWEWCLDGYEAAAYRQPGREQDPVVNTGEDRVMRGGCYM